MRLWWLPFWCALHAVLSSLKLDFVQPILYTIVSLQLSFVACDMDHQVARVCEVTGATPEVAKFYVEAAGGNIDSAIHMYLGNFY